MANYNKIILVGKDRKSTRLNSSHSQISYAVFCLKKKIHHVDRWDERALHFARWFFQDLRHDRMAYGLRRDARRPGGTRRPPDDELEFMHRQLYSSRRR